MLATLTDTIIGVGLAVVLALGYIVLWAIWYFGFRGKGDDHYHDSRR